MHFSLRKVGLKWQEEYLGFFCAERRDCICTVMIFILRCFHCKRHGGLLQQSQLGDFIAKYNPNVLLSFDYFCEDIIEKKQKYSLNHPLILVWEGMGDSTSFSQSLKGLEKYGNRTQGNN